MIGTSDNTLQIVIKAKDEASKVFKKFEKNNKETIKNLKKIGLVGGTAMAAVGTASVVMAANFSKSMANVSTLLDTNTEDMEKMKEEVLDMSTRVPVALDELTSALYDVRSAGISASGAMDVLENSAILAVAGLGSTQEATDILTSAINAFGLEATQSDKWADVFFKTVKSGKTNISELAQGFGQVAPLASEMGLKFEDLMSTVAAMTTSGMKASIAYTQVRAVMSSMLKPTKQMEEAMANVGITSENLSETMGEKGLREVITKLSNSVGGNQSELAKMFGSVEGLNAVMMMLGETGENATGIFNDMTKGENALNEAFEKQRKEASNLYQTLKNDVNKEMIKLGLVIIPILIATLPKLKSAVKTIKIHFDALTGALSEIIFKGIQAVEWMKKVKKSASEAISGASGIVGGAVGRVKGFLGLAEGGIVNKPTLAMIGEGSEPEAVIPLSKLGQFAPIVNINGGTYLSEDVAEQIGNLIIDKLKLNVRI